MLNTIKNILRKKRSIYLYNTLSDKKELYTSRGHRKVAIYSCGPTVYNNIHIGNLRAYVFADTLRRMFAINGYHTHYIINITDVGHLTDDADSGEDKIEKAAMERKVSVKSITESVTDAFFQDLSVLNIPISAYTFPKATEYIQEQIKNIQQLEKKGITYRTSDGIYYDTKKFSQYGALGNIPLDALEEGARVVKNTEKRNSTDFALWKFSPKNEKRAQEWESPWGVGFPGWHIECSTMAQALLGDTIDIHTGGIDHIPIHHNNEIAQSEMITHKTFARYWMHVAFLKINNTKISKSLGNTIALQDIEKKGFDPLDYRYLMLLTHYHHPLQFTYTALQAAHNARNKLIDIISESATTGSPIPSIQESIYREINDNLGTPQVIAIIWDMVKNKEYSAPDVRSTLLWVENILGIGLLYQKVVITPRVKDLLTKRKEARHKKDWKLSDTLRDDIKKEGYFVKDTDKGQEVKKL